MHYDFKKKQTEYDFFCHKIIKIHDFLDSLSSILMTAFHKLSSKIHVYIK